MRGRVSKLLVDIGNSRIKLARLTARRLGKMRAHEHRGSRVALGSALKPYRGKIDEVIAVSVAGERIERLLAAVMRRELGLPVRFVRSTTRVSGMRVGYSEPWRLGADRWVAAVGGYRVAKRRSVVVVDAGTALTIDVVARDGSHRGGIIIPGPRMMIDALLDRTQGIRARAAGIGSKSRRAAAGLNMGRNTRDAVDIGAALAAAALIDRVVADARVSLRARPALLMTGGAAPTIMPYLQSRAAYVPDLVLRGLAEFAP